MSYTTTRIDRRNLVKLAGWGMTGLRPPGRGNMHANDVSASRLTEQVAGAAQVSRVIDQQEAGTHDRA